MAGHAAEEAIRASREAAVFFQRFDKANLYHAAVQRSTGWLLGERGIENETMNCYEPISGFSLPDAAGEEGAFSVFIPKDGGAKSKPLRLQELQRITYELAVGVFVFNQTPEICLQPLTDGSSACGLPSAYHDTSVGNHLLEVDYFTKCLMLGTAIPQASKRERVNESWRRLAADEPSKLRERLKEMGLVYLIDDPELGHDLYDPKKEPFVRFPPKCADQELAQSELTPRLTFGEEFVQQENHLSRDMFLRYLEHAALGLTFRQRSFQQAGGTLVMDSTYDVTTRVCCSQTEEDAELYWRLHTYLQRQRRFVREHLQKKRDTAHSLALLHFTSFMTQLMVTLKQRQKVVSLKSLEKARAGENIHTHRELPPGLPSETSRWTPFRAQDSLASLRGEIKFHLLPREATSPKPEFLEAHKSLRENGSLLHSKELPTCTVGEQEYYVFSFEVEDFYTKSPKLPRWIHAMVSELRSHSASLPSLSSRVSEMLKKPFPSKKVTEMKTAPTQLLGSVEKGILPLVGLLLKRCTQTHLTKLDETGKALVHHAATHCHTDVLSALLHAGCAADQTCLSADLQPTQTQPLHLAARSGGLDAVMCLLHFGAQVLALDEAGWAAVHHAAFHNCQPLVLHLCTIERKCIELKTDDKASMSPLLLATKNGGYDTVRCLVDLGADITVKDRSGRGLVELAVFRHHISILQYLAELRRPELDLWEALSELLKADIASGYPEAAARSLDPLTQWSPAVAQYLLIHDVIQSLVELLKAKGSDKTQNAAVQVLANVSSDENIKEALKGIAVPPLVAMLSCKNDRVQVCACVVLCDLGTDPELQAAIAQAGAIPPLVKLLGSDADDVLLCACAALGILADGSTANQSTISSAAGLPAIKTLLSSDLSCIQACASSALQLTVEDNHSCQLSALSLDILPQLIFLLRSKEVSVHTNAAQAVEAMAENCEQCQQELLASPSCILLLKRLLRMKDQKVKVAGSCALWAIGGPLISNKRLIATHIGMTLLINMLAIHSEKLDYVCLEALGSLATELGGNQQRIMEVGGVKPLVEVLTIPTSQRVYLSAIATLSKLVQRPALTPNKAMQRAVEEGGGIAVLASMACSDHMGEMVCVSTARLLALLVLDNPEKQNRLLSGSTFSLETVFQFFSSEDPMVRIQAGQCLATLAFNNPAMVEALRQHHPINIKFYAPFLESTEEYLQCCTGFQLVVLSKTLTGLQSVDAAVRGVRLLVHLLGSDLESTQILSAEFIASLAHSNPGIPDTIALTGALDFLVDHLTSGSGPVVENCCVALGYLSFHPTPARMMLGMFRESPEKFEVFRDFSKSVVHSSQFMQQWEDAERDGLPVLSLESRGGPPAKEGWKISNRRCSSKALHQQGQQPSLGALSILTIGTEGKSQSTLQRVSFADLPTSSSLHPQHIRGSHTSSVTNTTATNLPKSTSHLLGEQGPLTARKLALSGSKQSNKKRLYTS